MPAGTFLSAQPRRPGIIHGHFAACPKRRKASGSRAAVIWVNLPGCHHPEMNHAVFAYQPHGFALKALAAGARRATMLTIGVNSQRLMTLARPPPPRRPPAGRKPEQQPQIVASPLRQKDGLSVWLVFPHGFGE